MAYEIKGKAISIGVNDSWQIAVDDVSSSTYDSSMGALGSSNRRAIIVPPGSYNQGVTMREYVDIYEEVPGGTINTGVIVNTVGSGYYISGDSPGDGYSSSGNTLTVSSVGGAGDRFATLQAAYDWLKSSDRDDVMGIATSSNRRRLVVNGNYDLDYLWTIDERFVDVYFSLGSSIVSSNTTIFETIGGDEYALKWYSGGVIRILTGLVNIDNLSVNVIADTPNGLLYPGNFAEYINAVSTDTSQTANVKLSTSGVFSDYTITEPLFSGFGVGDSVYFRLPDKYSRKITIDVGTGAVYSNKSLVWEYYNGIEWGEIEVLSDTTKNTLDSFEKDGSLTWEPLTDNKQTIINGEYGYWIRVRIVSSSITTSPTLSKHPYGLTFSNYGGFGNPSAKIDSETLFVTGDYDKKNIRTIFDVGDLIEVSGSWYKILSVKIEETQYELPLGTQNHIFEVYYFFSQDSGAPISGNYNYRTAYRSLRFVNCESNSNSVQNYAETFFADGIDGGTYINCKADVKAFRVGYQGIHKAKMISCIAGDYSFAGDSTDAYMSGEYHNCEGGNRCFAGCGIWGMPITEGALFYNCKAGDKSFGLAAVNKGSFFDCIGGSDCFAGDLVADVHNASFEGYARSCYATGNSFGASGAIGADSRNKGYMEGCTVLDLAGPIYAEGMTARNCKFTTSDADIDVIVLKDGNSKFSRCDFSTSGTGVGINDDGTARNVVVNLTSFNNDPDTNGGLGANITNLITTPYNVVDDNI